MSFFKYMLKQVTLLSQFSFVMVLMLSLQVEAGETDQDSWQYELMPYLWVVELDTTIGALPEVTVEADKFIDFFEMGGLIRFHAQKNKWGLTYNFVAFRLGVEDSLGGLHVLEGSPVAQQRFENVDIDAHVRHAVNMINASYTIYSPIKLDVIAGLRLDSVELDMFIDGYVPCVAGPDCNSNKKSIYFKEKQDFDAVSAVVGLTAFVPFTATMGTGIKAAVSAGDNISTQEFEVNFRWSFVENWQTTVGYRYAYMDYDDMDEEWTSNLGDIFDGDMKKYEETASGFLVGVGYLF